MEQNTQYAIRIKSNVKRFGECRGVRELTNSYLYQKYASSQNYYYTKDLNDVITDTRSAAAFVVKDLAQFDVVGDSSIGRRVLPQVLSHGRVRRQDRTALRVLQVS